MLAISAAIVSLPGLAQAQDATAGDAAVEEIVVTGTAIRGVAPVGSATVNITRDTITESGLRTPDSLISQLPQGSGIGSTLGANAGRSAGVNLRGLGGNATLLMFDGHRTVAMGVQNVNTDPNVIPFGAIERVEVVTDGASAVYGSDAVAGVVNYIFRRPFDGAEVTARWTHTLYDEGSVNAVVGKRWNGGGVLIAGAYEKNDRVTRYDIPQLRQDLRPFGGNDLRRVGTSITGVTESGGVIAGGQFYGLPSGLNGRTPTAAEVRPLLNSEAALWDRSQLEDYYTQRERFSVLGRVQQDFGRAGEFTATAMYNRRTNFARGQGDGGFQAIAVTLRPNSPYYIQGLGTGNQSLIYNFRLNNPDRELNRNDFEDTANLLLDYRVGLFGDFRLTTSAGFGISVACATCQPQTNTILTSFIADPPTASMFNPYRQGPQASAEPIFGIFLQKGRQRFMNLVNKIDGSLFELPAGAVRIAAGVEVDDYIFHQHSIYSLNPTTTWVTFRYAHNTRQVYSGFGEAFVPIFGAANAVTGFQRLDLSLALRYDKYSDFGSTTNPKVGVTWVPFDDLTLRGSWGTSFRAPTLSETSFNTTGAANRTFVPNGLNNPAIPVTNPATGQSLILSSSFRFTQLEPEQANIYSIGGDYSPSFIPGLRFGVTYYNVDYKDRISGLPNANNALATPEQFALYAPFFIPAPQPATCVNGSANGNPGAPEYATYNPLYLQYLNANGSFPPTTANDCQLVGILRTETRNLGRVVQSGLDFTLNYRTELSFGTFTLDGGFNKILKLKRNVLPDTPLVDALDVIGEQIGKRGRIQAGLRNGPFSAAIAANYIGGYLNNQTPTVAGVKLPDQRVPSWTTFDLNLSFAPDVDQGVFSGTRLTLNVRNFTDKDAPVVLTANSAADLDNHNVFGRMVTLELSKSF
jgi:iron complex outermembrane receptor protein